MKLSDRIRGAVWGQFVGDAACLGTHWIYDLDEMATRYPILQGFETPIAGHYHDGKQSGDLTHYGDAALLVLESVVATGHFDARDFGRRFVELAGSAEYHGYRDHATKGTLALYQANQGPDFDFQQGAADEQPATVTRLTPVVISHLQDPNWSLAVTALTQVCQNSHRALAYAHAHARLLRRLLLGTSLVEACEETVADLRQGYPLDVEAAERMALALAGADRSVQESTIGFGQSCPLINSFPAALQAALRYRDDFAAAVLEAMKAGGDNAGRCAMIGAWLGASLGVEAIPAEWRSKLSARERIVRLVETLVAKGS